MRIAPLANLVVRTFGVVLAFPPLLLMPVQPQVEGATLILVAHLGFNAVLALSALPLVRPLVGLIERMLPIPPADPDLAPLHLDQEQLGHDDLALASARRETVRIADKVQSMLADAGLALRGTDPALVRPILEAEDQVDGLYAAVKDYGTEFLRRSGPGEQSRQMLATLGFATDLEHIGDIIVHNLVNSAARKNKNRRSFSEAGLAEIMALHALVSNNMKLATTAFLTADERLAEEVIATKLQVHRSVLKSTDAHFGRIVERSGAALATSGLHLDILRDLKRINSHLVAACHRTRNGRRIDTMASVDAR
jgi:phosphate:Na+ symporter